MTDHPRFKRVQGSFDDTHSGGRLVQALFYLGNCVGLRHSLRHTFYKIDGRYFRRSIPASSKRKKSNLVRRLLGKFLRSLAAVLSAPKGHQAGWEGGARGL